ncbi:MAG TPA: MarR family winged helix-turn-helix transcriptional regulator [Polyangiaceae bacterium]
MDSTAEAFCALFPAVYVRFCRRGRDDASRLTPQMDGVLHHLSMSGPLTVGEMAQHFGRAQSVVSEIVAGMVGRGLLETMKDARDRRRTLVWLTDHAHEVLARRSQVLDPQLVAAAMKKLRAEERSQLVEVMRALVNAAERDADGRNQDGNQKKKRRRS